MHILKKIKKRFGLRLRNSSSCSASNNLPPLQFHMVHGDNIRLSKDRTSARRFESFCRAITFSARPIKVNERICVKLSEISNNWNGGIRFGFTSTDPSTLNNILPKYVCPDLTNRTGYWAKALHEQYCEKNNILTYYVNSGGDVVYCINNVEKGIILSGIDIRGLLWTVIDIYGNCTAIEFLDSKNYSLLQYNEEMNRSYRHQSQISLPISEINGFATSCNQISNISNDAISQQPLAEEAQQSIKSRLVSVAFHNLKGRNVILSQDRFTATRINTDFCQGYVFTSTPICIGEKIIISILKTDRTYSGSLALGLTSCNPSALQTFDLPDQSDFLLDRSEYWVISKDIMSNSKPGDEILFYLNTNGEIVLCKNNGPSIVLMHVENRLHLWAFLDIYGSTQSVRMFKQETISSTSFLNQNLLRKSQFMNKVDKKIKGQSESLNNISCKVPEDRTRSLSDLSETRTSNINYNCFPNSTIIPDVSNDTASGCTINMPPNREVIQIQPRNTILVVNIPSNNNQEASQLNFNIPSEALTNGCDQPLLSPNTSSCLTARKWNIDKNDFDSNASGAECTICYENAIDSVLYMCGHMCMCYECATEQWRGVGGGKCPICRAVIRDVIRTYST